MSSFRVLKTFIAVAETGSFTAAAERVALTSAAVGAQIRGLEDEIGRTLFVRQKTGAFLTEAGMALLPRTRRLLLDYDEMRTSAAADGALSGSITIGSINSAVGSVARTLARLKALYASLAVSVLLGDQSDLESKVVLGDLDAAIYVQTRTPEHRGTAWIPLYREQVMVAVSAKLISKKQVVGTLLKELPYIQFDHQSLTGAQIERALHRAGFDLIPYMELNALATIIDLVRQGVGISVVPVLRDLRWESDRSIRLLPFPGKQLSRTVGLLHTTRRSHVTSALVHHLVRDLRNTPAEASA